MLSTRANLQGRYIAWTDAGSVSLTAYSDSAAFDLATAQANFIGHTTVNLQLPPRTVVLSGRVTNPQGNLSWALVKAKEAGQPAAAAVGTYTNPDGTYALSLTPGKTYDITFSKLGWQTSEYLGLLASGPFMLHRPLAFISTAPVLAGGKVAPASGDENTTFTFEVTYSDANNNPPFPIKVVIDGVDYNMVPADPSDQTYTDGARYTYQTRLSGARAGHSYYFYAMDAMGVEAAYGLCEAKHRVGPCVGSPPVNVRLTPTAGTVSVGSKQKFDSRVFRPQWLRQYRGVPVAGQYRAFGRQVHPLDV